LTREIGRKVKGPVTIVGSRENDVLLTKVIAGTVRGVKGPLTKVLSGHKGTLT